MIVAPPWDLPDSESNLCSRAPSPEPPAPDLAHRAPRTPHSDSDPQPRSPRIPHSLLVIIEPSRGFGTGHHQSTRLCIALLQNRNLVGQTMIDVGTGSGVLAITAAKLGAAYVAAIDVDPDAVENARENIAANAVTEVVDAHVEDFTTASRSPADIVTANLTGTLLARHAVELAASSARPGRSSFQASTLRSARWSKRRSPRPSQSGSLPRRTIGGPLCSRPTNS